MRTISEIETAVNSFQRQQTQVQLRNRWDGDFDLFRLDPYDAGKGYYSYTSNAPRVLIKKIIAMLCEANLIIRIPGDLKKKKDRQIASMIERFLYGSFNLNDDMLLRRVLPTFRGQMAFLLALRGRAGFRTYVTKDEQDNAIPEIIPWDTYQMSYARGATGFDWACRKYNENPQIMASLYPNLAENLEHQTRGVTVYDFWDKEINAVIVDGKWGKKPDEHGLDECPVHLVMAGAMPDIESSSYENINTERGDSALDSSRGIYPLMNKTMSDALTIVRRGVKVPIGIFSDYDEEIEDDIWQVDRGGHATFKRDTVVKPLIEPSMPADTAPLLNIMSGELQRAGFPHTAYGELGFRLSGFAISQLQGVMGTVVGPFAQALEQAYRLASVSLLKQFASGDFKRVEVVGRTSRNEAFGYPEKLGIKPKEIKQNWYPEVSLIPTLPKDDAQRMMLAVQAKREGLLSPQTIREDYLEVEDVDLEQMKIDREFAVNLPLIRLTRIYWALIADGEYELARDIRGEIQRLRMQGMSAEGSTPPRPTPTGTEMEAMGTPGVGMPPGETGMPPSVMPPEMMGGMPPGAMRAGMPPEGEV